MYLKELLVTCLLITLASAVVPSYIKVCGRRNPKLNECIRDSVMALKERLVEGIPSLDVPPIDPFVLPEMVIIDLPNFTGSGKNMTVTGLSNFEIELIDVNLDKMTIDIAATFKNLRFTGWYDISARILVPIVGSGPLTININSVTSRASFRLKYSMRGGKKYVYFESMTDHLTVKDFTAEMGLDSGNIALREAINQVLGNSHEEIIRATKPSLERHVANLTLVMSNNICKHFPFEELFPDRE